MTTQPQIGTWDAPEPPRTSNKTGPATSERGNDMSEQRKLTPADIDAAIKSVEYSKMGEKTSVCLVTLVNGYELIGVSSCVDPANFDPQIGNDLALKKAKDQIWMLEGYVLQNKLTNDSQN